MQLVRPGSTTPKRQGPGGFGIVYRCTQVALDRVVAVKVLTAELDENRERFLREQRAMGRLTGHPNIVGVLQVGETGDGYPGNILFTDFGEPAQWPEQHPAL